MTSATRSDLFVFSEGYLVRSTDSGVLYLRLLFVFREDIARRIVFQ